MKLSLIFFLMVSLASFSQKGKAKLPSYFGFQFRPVFPTQFIGDPELKLEKEGFHTNLSQKTGYAFGATVRAGLTKLIAIETGINYTHRNFNMEMGYTDSNSFASNDWTFIEYDIPVNALFYIQLAEQWYMNASPGAAITFKPTDIKAFHQPGGHHYYSQRGLVNRKTGLDINANIGFEFRTEKNGFFYLGGSGRVPFTPLFTLISDYTYQGNAIRMYGDVDGSFLAIDFKYFFPIVQNKGVQMNKGPIEQ